LSTNCVRNVLCGVHIVDRGAFVGDVMWWHCGL